MMPRGVARGAGILMGALLVLFLAPRELFHDCAHDAGAGIEGTAGVSAPAHCAACDMVVPPFEQAPRPIVRSGISLGVALDAPFVAQVVSGHVCIASARGPPTMA